MLSELHPACIPDSPHLVAEVPGRQSASWTPWLGRGQQASITVVDEGLL